MRSAATVRLPNSRVSASPVSASWPTIGMTVVIIAGGIDLSVGAMVAVASVIVTAAESQFEPVVGIVMSLTVGILAGLGNGLLVTRGRINQSFRCYRRNPTPWACCCCKVRPPQSDRIAHRGRYAVGATTCQTTHFLVVQRSLLPRSCHSCLSSWLSASDHSPAA
jgi:hypothetical protein